MYQVTREIPFCYGHRLLNYQGKCKNLHGHNGTAVITLCAPELDSSGMVLDFSEIKKLVSAWIDETLDHRMLLCKDDPLLPFLRQMGEPICVMDGNPTAENIARYIFEFVLSRGFPVTQVTLWETESCCATYAPTPAAEPGRDETRRKAVAARPGIF